MVKEQCDMQQTIGIQRKDLRTSLTQWAEDVKRIAMQWAAAKSVTYTVHCGSDGEVFTRADVVKAHLFLIVVFILVCLGGAIAV